MSDTTLKAIPEPTLRRLPAYHHFLKILHARGREVVSCSYLGEHLRLDPTQIRKDLACTGITGKPKVGYEVGALIDAIESFLGWNNVNDAFLVGVGNLGAALLGYQRFNQYGLNIAAAFDTDLTKIGTMVHERQVLPLEKLPDLAQRMHVRIGIITVPASAAQSVANVLVLSGVEAIWNFAPTPIEAPEGIIVQNQDLFSSLAVLSGKLAASQRASAASL